MHPRLCALMLVGLLAACGGSPMDTPTGPTPSAMGAPASGATTSLASSSGVHGPPLPFPPRDESVGSRLELERIYRTELGRAPVTRYVDVEGDAIWTQEYMRYRVHGCSPADAARKVLDQVAGGPAAPVCDIVAGSLVAFPPHPETADFRQRLDAVYRDGLQRTPSASYVDDLGAVVWLQEYLRYRVYGCDDAAARTAVHEQIRGAPPPPVCFVPPPALELLGHWTGIIDMGERRPFRLDVNSQHGNTYSGDYHDYKYGSATLTRMGEDGVKIFVYFGDGAMFFEGRFTEPTRVEGTMTSPSLSRPYIFDMTRY